MPYMTNQSWRQRNKDRWNEYQRQRYLEKVGALSRKSPLETTPEYLAQYARDKANRRVTRAKAARIKDELTEFVTKELHHLRQLRDKATGFLWHVDHVIPLKGKQVSGLHIWSNLQLIPKSVNLSKGNKHALYDKWQTGLQETVREV